jgi:hypothetical protein
LPLLFNFAFEYVIRKVPVNQVGLILNWTYKLLVYADGVNLLRYNIDTINRSTEKINDASEEVDLEVNTEKTNYMLLCHHQNAGQNHDIKTADRSFKMWYSSNIWGRIITNQNLIQEGIKTRD